MCNLSDIIRRVTLTAAAFLIIGFISPAVAKKPAVPPTPVPPSCDAAQPNYVVFLDDYPEGRFQLAILPCLSGAEVPIVTSRELALDLPRKLQRTFQIGNGDIYSDGNRRRIVFGGRASSRDYWDIYQGVIDIGHKNPYRHSFDSGGGSPVFIGRPMDRLQAQWRNMASECAGLRCGTGVISSRRRVRIMGAVDVRKCRDIRATMRWTVRRNCISCRRGSSADIAKIG